MTWPTSSTAIDVLSYVLPNAPNGVTFSNIAANTLNPWHTFSNSYFAGHERLPGFFITKGNLDGNLVAWNFEEMIYDASWIYLVRDTSWTSTCENGRPAGMLVFHWDGSQFLRGGRHFPRFITNGGTADTGVTKYVQGVEIKKSPGDNAQDGRWCQAQFSGFTGSTIRADLLGARTVGNTTFTDVLQLQVIAGAGAGDIWWYARGYGLIRFTDGHITEQFSFKQDNYNVQVHIPCEPNYCM